MRKVRSNGGTKSESDSPNRCPWTTYRHLNKIANGFSMSYDEKGLVHISEYDIQLLLPLKLRKMTQHHQIMCGC